MSKLQLESEQGERRGCTSFGGEPLSEAIQFPTGNVISEPATYSLNNRETWLHYAADELRDVFSELRFHVPQNIAIACGWPSTGALARKRRRLGECWSAAASRGDKFEIFISPFLEAPMDVLSVLAHELVHVVVGPHHGHRGPFRRTAIEIGLVGPMRSTRPGEELRQRLNALSNILGPYPHKAISDEMTNHRRKQSTRLHRVICPECGYLARITTSWLARGVPTCPCGEIMQTRNAKDATEQTYRWSHLLP